jgi:hypothetical protein
MPVKALVRTFGGVAERCASSVGLVGAPKYERAPRGSAVHEFERRIRALLTSWPTMPATVITAISCGHPLVVRLGRVHTVCTRWLSLW